MKQRHKFWFLCIVGLFFVLILGYFYVEEQRLDRSSTISKEKERTKIEITFATGDVSWNRAIMNVADQFMSENPDIEVVLLNSSTAVQSDLYSDYLKKQLAVDGLGDIIEIRNRDFFDGTDVLAPLPDRLTELVNCKAAEDGNVYVLPECYGTQGIVYNKTLFDKLHLEEPDTYDEFIEICEELKRYRITPIVVGANDRWHFGFWLNHFFRTDVLMKNMSWTDECKEGKVSWTDEEPRKMFRDLKFIYDQGYVNEDYLWVKDSETAVLMAEGNVGMLYAGPWVVPNIRSLNSSMELGWFYLPDNNGERCIFLDQSSGWGITSECSRSPEKYEAAQKFLEFFFAPEIFVKICETTNGIPSVRTSLKMEDLPFLEEIQQELKECEIYTDRQISDTDTQDNFIRIIYDKLPLFLENELSEEDFINELNESWKDCANND